MPLSSLTTSVICRNSIMILLKVISPRLLSLLLKTVCGKSMTSDFSSVSSGRAYAAMVSLTVLMTYTKKQGIVMFKTENLGIIQKFKTYDT